MKMLTKVVALLTGLAAALLLSVGVASTATAAPRPAVDPTAVTVSGTTLVNGVSTPIAGTFDVTRFVTQNGTLQAVGTFTGTSGVTGTLAGDAAGQPGCQCWILPDPGSGPRTAGP